MIGAKTQNRRFAHLKRQIDRLCPDARVVLIDAADRDGNTTLTSATAPLYRIEVHGNCAWGYAGFKRELCKEAYAYVAGCARSGRERESVYLLYLVHKADGVALTAMEFSDVLRRVQHFARR